MRRFKGGPEAKYLERAGDDERAVDRGELCQRVEPFVEL
jgi:hypothetical protein